MISRSSVVRVPYHVCVIRVIAIVNNSKHDTRVASSYKMRAVFPMKRVFHRPTGRICIWPSSRYRVEAARSAQHLKTADTGAIHSVHGLDRDLFDV